MVVDVEVLEERPGMHRAGIEQQRRSERQERRQIGGVTGGRMLGSGRLCATRSGIAPQDPPATLPGTGTPQTPFALRHGRLGAGSGKGASVVHDVGVGVGSAAFRSHIMRRASRAGTEGESSFCAPAHDTRPVRANCGWYAPSPTRSAWATLERLVAASGGGTVLGVECGSRARSGFHQFPVVGSSALSGESLCMPNPPILLLSPRCHVPAGRVRVWEWRPTGSAGTW